MSESKKMQIARAICEKLGVKAEPRPVIKTVDYNFFFKARSDMKKAWNHSNELRFLDASHEMVSDVISEQELVFLHLLRMDRFSKVKTIRYAVLTCSDTNSVTVYFFLTGVIQEVCRTLNIVLDARKAARANCWVLETHFLHSDAVSEDANETGAIVGLPRD